MRPMFFKGSGVNQMLINAGVLGGVVVFCWKMVSRFIFPWHTWAINHFTHEDAVMSCLQENAPTSGLYLLAKGPIIFASINLHPERWMTLFSLSFPLLFLSLQQVSLPIFFYRLSSKGMLEKFDLSQSLGL